MENDVITTLAVFAAALTLITFMCNWSMQLIRSLEELPPRIKAFKEGEWSRTAFAKGTRFCYIASGIAAVFVACLAAYYLWGRGTEGVVCSVFMGAAALMLVYTWFFVAWKRIKDIY